MTGRFIEHLTKPQPLVEHARPTPKPSKD